MRLLVFSLAREYLSRINKGVLSSLIAPWQARLAQMC